MYSAAAQDNPMPSAPRPFRIDIPAADLTELAQRLDRTRWPDELPGADWSYGVNKKWLRELADGVHVNALAFAAFAGTPDELELLDTADRERALAHERWWYGRSGYMHQMSTRPQTIAYALNDSPVGQLA